MTFFAPFPCENGPSGGLFGPKAGIFTLRDVNAAAIVAVFEMPAENVAREPDRKHKSASRRHTLELKQLAAAPRVRSRQQCPQTRGHFRLYRVVQFCVAAIKMA
ncbi:hypothetical protein [Paraburkholderia sp.]|uniref:hypothetical protein n=1 Tax=Paraburkholderia sp. TaxID=1926495 RepID=UPI0039E4B3CC